MMSMEWRAYVDSHARQFPGDSKEYADLAAALVSDLGIPLASALQAQDRIADYLAAVATWSADGAFDEGRSVGVKFGATARVLTPFDLAKSTGCCD